MLSVGHTVSVTYCTQHTVVLGLVLCCIPTLAAPGALPCCPPQLQRGREEVSVSCGSLLDGLPGKQDCPQWPLLHIAWGYDKHTKNWCMVAMEFSFTHKFCRVASNRTLCILCMC